MRTALWWTVLAGCREVAAEQELAEPAHDFSRCLSAEVEHVLGDPAALERAANPPEEEDEPAAGGPRVIPVYFHVITDTAGNGDVSDLVPAQMEVLNDGFEGRVEFELVGLDVTANDDWYTAGLFSDAELEMKGALRQGGADAFNVYTGSHELELGWAGGPWIYQNVPEFDGAVVSAQTLPAGTLAFPDAGEPDGELAYNKGDTLLHEVGHWLGLFHTFQFQPGQPGYGPNSGCSIDNDLVRDTPAEASVQYYCVERDSCTGDAFVGEDSLDNFMAYVDDDCMEAFTEGQFQRMRKQFLAYRDE